MAVLPFPCVCQIEIYISCHFEVIFNGMIGTVYDDKLSSGSSWPQLLITSNFKPVFSLYFLCWSY